MSEVKKAPQTRTPPSRGRRLGLPLCSSLRCFSVHGLHFGDLAGEGYRKHCHGEYERIDAVCVVLITSPLFFE